MSVIQGKVHQYLVTTVDYTFCGQVRITILGYIEDILTNINKVDPKGKGTKSRAATNNIFVVKEDVKNLDQ